jgi:hypothetical protein
MLQEIIEPAWLDAFEAVLGRCALQKGDTVAILAETQSRPVLPLLARLAAQRLGAQVFTLTLPSVVGPRRATRPGRRARRTRSSRSSRWSMRWPPARWWWTAPWKA